MLEEPNSAEADRPEGHRAARLSRAQTFALCSGIASLVAGIIGVVLSAYVLHREWASLSRSERLVVLGATVLGLLVGALANAYLPKCVDCPGL